MRLSKELTEKPGTMQLSFHLRRSCVRVLIFGAKKASYSNELKKVISEKKSNSGYKFS